MNRGKTVEHKFNARVIKREPNECWEISGAHDGNGYAQIWDESSKKILGAHRVSYELHYKESAKGKEVMHICDNPRCVNPHHLMLGSHLENSLDASNKGRIKRGERHPFAKINSSIVKQILFLREVVGMRNVDVAKLYGISPSTVCGIEKGRQWKHITQINQPKG